jgi:hypothetical protein
MNPFSLYMIPLRIVSTENMSRPSSTNDLARRWSANASSNRASFATKNKQSYTFGMNDSFKINEQIYQ